MTIYDVIHSVWHNHPSHASTMSMCKCGRYTRRGGEPCLECLTDKLMATGKVSRTGVKNWFKAIGALCEMQKGLVDAVGEGTEL